MVKNHGEKFNGEVNVLSIDLNFLYFFLFLQ